MLNPLYKGPRRITKWGRPPKHFEQDRDMYNHREFKRRYYREQRRQALGISDTHELYHDDTIKHMQCPYDGCNTWFPAPIELVEKKYKRTYTGFITCPCCHQTSKVGRAGELEQIERKEV